MWTWLRRKSSKPDSVGVLAGPDFSKTRVPNKHFRWSLTWGSRRLSSANKTNRPVAQDKAASILRFGGANYIFGLDWRMIPPTRQVARALAMARKEGQFWYVTSEVGDFAGFLKKPQWLLGRNYSASLHLASQFSQGGVELFVFVFPDTRYAVLALQESRPLPGLDQLTDEATAHLMVDEFLAIQRGQPIRLVGNTTWLEGQETMLPDDIFAEPKRATRIRSLHSGRVISRLVVSVLLAVGTYVFGNEFLETQRSETLTELQNSPAYQQKKYREDLAKAWTLVGPEADLVLSNWYTLLAKMPLHHQGWALQRIECQISQCRAYWLREFGSFQDFTRQLPVGAQSIDEKASDQESVTSKIVTLHPVAFEKNSMPVIEDGLQSEVSSRRKLGDLFQDFQFLGHAITRIEPAVLFGGDQNPEILKDAVVSGKWSLRHQLWLLPSISLPRFVRVQNLLVELRSDPKDNKQGAAELPSAIAMPQFELSGAYYAKY